MTKKKTSTSNAPEKPATGTPREPADAADARDVVEHHVATDAAESARFSDEDRRWSKDLGVQLESRLAELRRRLTPADAPIETAKPIRPSTQAMTRDALVEGITLFAQSRGGAVQYAHRNLRGLSDDDLRRLYDTLDPTAHEPS